MIRSSRASSGPPTAESLRPQLEMLAGYTKLADREASTLLATDFMPFEKDPDDVREVQRHMKEWMMETIVRNDPEVRDAVGRVLQRRRKNAPAGVDDGGDSQESSRGEGCGGESAAEENAPAIARGTR